MSVFHWNSLQDLFAIQEKMNRLFEETIHRTEFPDDDSLDAALWSPAADVYETPEEIILQIELPGVRLEDVRLEALDGKLRVAGHRRAEAGVQPRNFVRMERIYGSFSREFPAPATIDPARIKATLRAGVLKVIAIKSAPGEPIPVESRRPR
ncbi:MAG TPA: Hsp20/alpha crystallin family protein [Thermoanaerobaculia bacterium]|jgi:HSP20 family protein|nr:Hsp20/alpha crystallin family protein [Thermoanaerobaculia bacterium]